MSAQLRRRPAEDQRLSSCGDTRSVLVTPEPEPLPEDGRRPPAAIQHSNVAAAGHYTVFCIDSYTPIKKLDKIEQNWKDRIFYIGTNKKIMSSAASGEVR